MNFNFAFGSKPNEKFQKITYKSQPTLSLIEFQALFICCWGKRITVLRRSAVAYVQDSLCKDFLRSGEEPKTNGIHF